LGQPDPYYVLPVLVFGTMYLQQKLLTPQTPPSKDGKEDPTQAMSKSMQTTMPLMFGFFSLSFPSGLSIYFVLSNLIGIAQGYYMRRVTAKEKEEAAAQKKGRKGKQEIVLDEPAASSADVAVAQASDAEITAVSSNPPAPSSTKQKSKRKRRSKKN
jgi:membrane protein insertase Oxa1/YidC/SpoIIIJ